MKAMILAAGLGTRLLPLTEKIPKPMIPISSEPLIVHQLRWLRRGGVKDVVVNLHHLGHQIKAHLGNGRQFGVNIKYSPEEEILETGGGIVKALPLLGEDEFIVLNGDVWTSFRFQRTVNDEFATIHLILVPIPDERETGDFGLHGSKVVRYADAAKNEWVYSGIAYVKPEVFADETVRPFSFRDTLYREVEVGHVTGQQFEGTWFDVGTHEQLKRVRRLML